MVASNRSLLLLTLPLFLLNGNFYLSAAENVLTFSRGAIETSFLMTILPQKKWCDAWLCILLNNTKDDNFCFTPQAMRLTKGRSRSSVTEWGVGGGFDVVEWLSSDCEPRTDDTFPLQGNSRTLPTSDKCQYQLSAGNEIHVTVLSIAPRHLQFLPRLFWEMWFTENRPSKLPVR